MFSSASDGRRVPARPRLGGTLLLSCALAMPACADPGRADSGPADTGGAAPASPAGPVMAGGWSAMSPHDPELREVIHAAVGRLGGGPPAGVVEAERQVVAGTNFRLLLAMANGQRYRVVVWKKLDGQMDVTSVERVP